MSFGDLFYPDNPKRRQKVFQLSQKVLDLMDRNFDATNDLIVVLNNNCDTNISSIKLNEKSTLKENCDAFIAKIKEIQSEVEKINSRLAKKLDPAIYQAIHNVDLSFQDTFQLIKKTATALTGIAATITSTIVVVMISKGFLLSGMVTSIGVVATCAISVLAIGAIFVGVDMLVSIFTGAEEREDLENAIKDLENVLREFEPASKEYTRRIYKVLAAVDTA